jgi:hypothetical protein
MHRVFAGFVVALALVAAGAPRAAADIVYAVSNNDGRIIRYDSANPAGTVVTLSGTGVLTFAAGLALGPDGNLYVGESGDLSSVAPSVRRLDLTTNTLSTVHTFTDFSVVPGSLAFKGNDLLVGRNPFYGNTGPIVKIANATGGVIAVSDYTSGGSLASSPGLALAADGTLYVSDQTYVSGNASGPVKRFDALGAYVGEVITGGTASGLLGPTGLAISGTTLYTASIMSGAVLRTNLTNDSTVSFASTGVPYGASPLALLSDGGLLVGSAGGAGAIYQFDAAGSSGATFNSGLGTIGGITVAPVPEPSAALLGVVGVACVGGWMRRRRAACPR